MIKSLRKLVKVKNIGSIVLNTICILIILALIYFVLTNQRYEYLELLNF